MTDEQIIARAVERWRDGEQIADGEARVIAASWYAYQVSALYSLASCGAIDGRTAGEIDRELRGLSMASDTDPRRLELSALLEYVEASGERGPVAGWSDLWGRS